MLLLFFFSERRKTLALHNGAVFVPSAVAPLELDDEYNVRCQCAERLTTQSGQGNPM